MIAREGSLSVRGALFSAVTLFLILEPGEFTDAVYSLMRRGIWSAAERGIFVRHPRLFEMADRSKKLAVPLFGILTKGAPRVEGMQSFTPHHRSKDVLSLAASVVGTYIHPIAEAIRRAAEEERIPPLFVGSASLMWKGGAEGRVKIAGMTRTVFVGSRRACSESGIGMRPAVAEIVGREEEEGKIILLVAVDREIVGMVALRDDIIPGAEEAIRTIEELGNEVCLLTGVSEVPVRVLARSVGIRNTLSDLTPQEKERAMRDFQTEGLTVLAAGAGWKDEPVLRAASASIVSSRAREFLQESGADCLLFGGGIEGAARVMDFSRALMKRIRQATWLVFLFILLAALIAAGALIPFGGFAPNPIAIAAAKVAISMVIYRASL